MSTANNSAGRPLPQPSDTKTVTELTRSSVGVLLEETQQIGPGHPPSSLVERLQASLLKRAFPSHPAIRGVAVAADCILNALISAGTIYDYDLFFHLSHRRDEPELTALYRGKENRHGKVRTSFLGRSDSSAGEGLTAWLNLSPFQSRFGGIERSQHLRLHSGQSRFPITTLFHGLSANRMRYEVFLQSVLGGAQPNDSLISTSTASKRALANILEGLSEDLEKDFGLTVHYKGRLDLIPLCVDTASFGSEDKKRCRDTLRLPSTHILLLYIGRLSYLKADLTPFLGVLRNLVRRNPSQKIKWIIAGTEDPGYIDHLKRVSVELGVSESLSFFTNVTDEHKRLLLGAADIFFSPSDSVQESFGLTPIESLASGLPQVVANWDGYRDTVVDGVTGFLVPVYWTRCDQDLSNTGSLLGWESDHLLLGQSIALDVGRAEHYLNILINNAELRSEMGVASRKRAASLYSFETVAASYEALWRELTASVGPTRSFRDPTFNNARYYDTFGHYASHTLTGDAQLVLSSAPPLEALQGPRSMALLLGEQYVPPLGRELSETVRQLFSSKGSPVLTREQSLESKRIRLQDLVHALGEIHPASVERLTRHVMWMIKYGQLVVIN